MKVNIFKYFFIIIFCLLSFESFTQNIIHSSYSIQYPFFDDLDKKTSKYQQSRIDQLPSSINLFKINNDIVEVGVSKDSIIQFVSIYCTEKKQRVSFKDDKVEFFDFNYSHDTLFFEKTRVNDSLISLSFMSDSIFPTNIFINDSSYNDSSFLIDWNYDFPLISFLQEFSFYPSKVIFGSPKVLKSYNLESVKCIDHTGFYYAYRAVLQDEQSSENVSVFLNFIEKELFKD
ncbi:MAG: hypothetical protein ACPGVD_07150 [Flavobacteriales bacterium]